MIKPVKFVFKSKRYELPDYSFGRFIISTTGWILLQKYLNTIGIEDRRVSWVGDTYYIDLYSQESVDLFCLLTEYYDGNQYDLTKDHYLFELFLPEIKI